MSPIPPSPHEVAGSGGGTPGSGANLVATYDPDADTITVTRSDTSVDMDDVVQVYIYGLYDQPGAFPSYNVFDDRNGAGPGQVIQHVDSDTLILPHAYRFFWGFETGNVFRGTYVEVWDGDSGLIGHSDQVTLTVDSLGTGDDIDAQYDADNDAINLSANAPIDFSGIELLTVHRPGTATSLSLGTQFVIDDAQHIRILHNFDEDFFGQTISAIEFQAGGITEYAWIGSLDVFAPPPPLATPHFDSDTNEIPIAASVSTDLSGATGVSLHTDNANYSLNPSEFTISDAHHIVVPDGGQGWLGHTLTAMEITNGATVIAAWTGSLDLI